MTNTALQALKTPDDTQRCQLLQAHERHSGRSKTLKDLNLGSSASKTHLGDRSAGRDWLRIAGSEWFLTILLNFVEAGRDRNQGWEHRACGLIGGYWVDMLETHRDCA